MLNGRFNVYLGLAALVVAAVGGMALGQTLEPYYRNGYGQIPLWRYLIKAGHTHGMLLGLVNIVFGMLIGRAECAAGCKRWGAAFAALSLCVPLGVALRGLTEGAVYGKVLAMLGTFSFLAACVLMVVMIRTAPDSQ